MLTKTQPLIGDKSNIFFHMEIGVEPTSYDVVAMFDSDSRISFGMDYGSYHHCQSSNMIQTRSVFDNPTEKLPMNICGFFKHFDISPILKVFADRYGGVNYHYRYPMDAMIRASFVRRIKCMRSFQKLVNRFILNKEDAKDIGFKEKIPDRRTFRHWENVRNDTRTLNNAMKAMIKAIQKEMKSQGMQLGKRIAIDATPFESLFNDKDARYNGHYEISGYKIFGVHDLDHNIPLAFILTPADVGDSPLLIPLLKRIKKLGIDFEEVYADGAFNGFENFAYVRQECGAKFLTKLHKNSILKKEGMPEAIQKRYNEYRYEKDFVLPDELSFQKKLDYLLKKGDHRFVGAYHRNEFMPEWEMMEEVKNRKIAPSQYNIRNLIEGWHGFVKKYLNIQTYFDKKGYKKTENHVYWTYMAVLGLALTRLQNGITEDLIQLAFFD